MDWRPPVWVVGMLIVIVGSILDEWELFAVGGALVVVASFTTIKGG